ncbi:ribonuclease HI family protein [Convivina praedatoris]|uniref:14.7 kDa ribonuclease H-like protein n=1 Tax=Convivina praedatoris TaxID=2880963 RepID=A0ABN8HGM8_9LACO|nr:ribonuclease HI family protein [Convivina sp. LMG 32447]CAH1853449.1 14.7 kDa ribonuclease H-like protein [Convivina sp. LMG 32447]CAH1854856.1 14.7 kDa ribonuclease H-like protein [Convivina sp. LMG 32447]CAH1854953.1 14.7 kDa ribonuclease H-like protein [Convivina sp. LMG 32447]
MLIKIHFDAARQPSTGHSAAGCLLIINGQQEQLKVPLPLTNDNHQAEFLAAIWALSNLPTGKHQLHLYSDSKLLVDALNKNYAKHYQIYVDRLHTILAAYPLVLIDWVSEKQNQGPHHLALQALKNADRL